MPIAKSFSFFSICLWVCLWVYYHDNSKLRASFFTKVFCWWR